MDFTNESITQANLQFEISEPSDNTLTVNRTGRPANTKNVHGPKLIEFKKWCEDKGFSEPTKETVMPGKAHLFLVEQVVGCSSKKRKRCGRDEEESTSVVGAAVVDEYASALVDLWKEQKELGVNNYPNPRDGLISDMIKNLKRQEDAREEEAFAERGVGTLLDGYSTQEDLKKISEQFLSSTSTTIYRNRLAFLFGHFGMLRGESIRAMNLADIYSVELPSEGYTECRAIAFITGNGKTNQTGRCEYGSFIRHKMVEICPVGALAIHLFHRFHMTDESFPDFSRSENWCKIKLLFDQRPSSRDNTTPISYDTHLKFTNSALRSAGFKTKAKIHSPRGPSSRIAKSSGASTDQIRKAGRWNSSLEGAYFTQLARESMRTLAGFPAQAGSFFLRRSCEVPSELLGQVFGEVDSWLIRQEQQEDCESNMVAIGFLKLLRYLRSVLLQDAPHLIALYPTLSIWQHPLFLSSSFRSYCIDATNRINTVWEPAESELQRAISHFMEHTNSLHKSLSAKIEKIGTEVQNTCMQSRQDNMELQRRHSSQNKMLSDIFRVLSTHLKTDDLTPLDELVTLDQTTSQPLSTESEQLDAYPLNNNLSSTVPASYRMSRSVNNVTDLWREFSVGLGGGPSIQSLEETHKSAWRRSDAERKYFKRRKVIVDEVQKIANEKNIDTDEAVVILERFRLSLRNKSLDSLRKELIK